jgi:pyridoxamine 5'-phosphate oxidase
MAEPLEDDPLVLLRRWLAEAEAAGVPMPSTATLATTSEDEPHARTVVITAVEQDGLRFHSSTPTTKSRDLARNPRASLVFHWPALGRQVVLACTATELDETVSRAAYPTRPRQLQLIAWAYEDLGQDLAEPERAVPTARVQERMDVAAARDPRSLPMPPSWTTYLLRPHRVDVWRASGETTAPLKDRYLRRDASWDRVQSVP